MHLSALATLTGIVQDEACDDGIFIGEAVPLRQCLLVHLCLQRWIPQPSDDPNSVGLRFNKNPIMNDPHGSLLKVSLYGDSSANLLRPFISAKSTTKPELGTDFTALI